MDYPLENIQILLPKCANQNNLPSVYPNSPQTVDPPTGRHIVQRIQHQGKLTDVRHVEGRGVAHVAVEGLVLHAALTTIAIFAIIATSGRYSGSHGPTNLTGNHALGHADVLTSKQKLAVQIRHIDRVEIDNSYFCETRQGEVFQELASDSTGSDEEDGGGCYALCEGGAEGAVQAGEEGMAGGGGGGGIGGGRHGWTIVWENEG